MILKDSPLLSELTLLDGIEGSILDSGCVKRLSNILEVAKGDQALTLNVVKTLCYLSTDRMH